MYSSGDNDAKSCLFLSLCFEWLAGLHVELDLFSRINLVRFQLVMNRVTHGGHSGLGEGSGVWISPLQPAFFTYFMHIRAPRTAAKFPRLFWNEMMLLRHCKWSLTVGLLMQTAHFTMRLHHPRHNIIYNDVDEIRLDLNPEHTARLWLLRKYNLR